MNYLDERKEGDKPFFSFVFYDLLHAIDIPAPYRKKFQPSWDYANYLALNNNLDRNRSLTCTVIVPITWIHLWERW